MTTITNSITIGSGAYPSPYTIASGQAIIPTASAAYAVTLLANASLTNHGLIQGGSYGGNGITLATGLIINSGIIIGGAGSDTPTPATSNGGYGINMTGPFGGYGPATIINSGTILGGAGGAGNNGSAYSAAGTAVGLYGAGTSLNNSGLIRGGAGGAYQPGSKGQGGAGGIGVTLANNAALTNTGTIAGGAGGAGAQAGSGGYGVFMESYSTLINTGVIIGGSSGTGTTPQGSAAGIYLRDGLLVNAGTIIAGATPNSSGIRYAVRFGVTGYGTVNASTLVVEHGAKFDGVVSAISFIYDVLELGGAGPVTLSGIGTEYKYFHQISFANAGQGVISGNSYGLAHGVIISGFTAQDSIILDGFAATSETVAGGTNLTLASGTLRETLDIAGSFSAADFSISSHGGNTTITTDVMCFCAGTAIATPRGPVPVEDLRIGDLVNTLFGPPVPILWLGRRAYDARFIAGNHLAEPIHFAPSAIAPGVPARKLLVSPGHGIYIDGVLVPAWRLLNGVTITQPACTGVIEFIHIETEAHEIVLAENCPAETFLDIGMRGLFQNAAEYQALYPVPRRAAAALPRVESGFALAAIEQRLATHAGLAQPSYAPGPLRWHIAQARPPVLRGWAQNLAAPEQPVCLDVFCDGQRIARLLANQYDAAAREAGWGSGCHGFACELPATAGDIAVRRAADGVWLENNIIKTAAF